MRKEKWSTIWGNAGLRRQPSGAINFRGKGGAVILVVPVFPRRRNPSRCFSGGASNQNKMKQQIKIFLALSAVILIIDLVFVWINYKSSYNALLNTLVRDADSTERAFAQALDMHVGELLQMATFLAEREDLQTLFLRGKIAAEEEGGGPGAEKAASARKTLRDAVEETWEVMETTYSLKELNFILAPDSIFFLRAQSPENFGDPTPKMRYIITHANNKLKPAKGFETGEAYSGIFGVAPVIVHDADSGQKIHVGSVETGASLSIILPVLDAQLNAGVAILLSRSHLKTKMSPEFFARRFSGPPLDGNLFVEASSRPEIDSLLESESVSSLLSSSGTRLIDLMGLRYSVTSFPFRDFTGRQDPNLPDAGKVLVWQRTKPILNFERGIMVNIVYAVAGFVFIEMLLFFLVHRYEKMSRIIQKKSSELQKAHDDLEQRVEAMERYRQQLRQLNNRLQTTREEEKTRIAREVHDELGQALTALKMELSCLESGLDEENQPLREISRSMGKLIDSTVQSVQRICTELRPQILDVLGIYDAIEWQAAEYQKRTGIQCELTGNGEGVALDRDRSTAFFRIFQETMTNVARHANASKVMITFKKENGSLVLEVRDNGKGIDPAQIFGPNSFGLIGIRERVLLWEGEANIDSSPGEGTTISVKIPYETESKPKV